MNARKTMVVAVGAALCGALASGCAVVSPNPAPHVTPMLEIRHSGLQADGYYQLGRFLQLHGRHKEAEEAYLKALALDPLNVDSHNGLGTLRALNGQYDEAHRSFNAALAIAPANGAVLNNVGYAYLLERRHAEAADAFRRAVASAPGNVRYRANLEVALRGGSEPVAALDAPASAGIEASPAAEPAPAATPAAEPQAGVRLVAAGPNVFELVVPTVPSQPTLIADAPRAPAVRHAALEVSNGHGAGGMARRIAGQLKSEGLAVRRVTNHLPYGRVGTHILYRAGNLSAAIELSRRLPGQPQLVESSALRQGIDVRLVLGKDLASNVALTPAREAVASAH